jgi:hypothetical protein
MIMYGSYVRRQAMFYEPSESEVDVSDYDRHISDLP